MNNTDKSKEELLQELLELKQQNESLKVLYQKVISELKFQNDENKKRTTELLITNKELTFQNEENEKRAEELIKANRELAFQSEEKFKSIYESSEDAIMLLNENGFLDCNSKTLEIFGINSKEEFLGSHPSEQSPPTQPDGRISFEAANENISIAYKQGFNRFDWIHRRSNGDDFPTEVLLSAFKIGGQQVLQATVRDITERKKIEKHILHLNTVLKVIRNVNQLITRERNPNILIRVACKKLVESRGYHHASIVTIDRNNNLIDSASTALDPNNNMEMQFKNIEELPFCLRKALTQPEVLKFDNDNIDCRNCLVKLNEGSYFSLSLRLEFENVIYGVISVSIPIDFIYDKEEESLFRELAGDISFALSTIESEKEKDSAEEALRENKIELSTITDSVQDAIIMMNEKGNITFWNPAAELIFGYSTDEVNGKNLHEFLAPNRYLQSHLDAFPKWQESGKGNVVGKTLELIAVRKCGQEFPIELSLSSVKLQNHWVAVGILRDIFERKMAEESLIEAEKKYRNIFENALEGIFQSTPDGHFIVVNPSFAKMLEYDSPDDLISSITNIAEQLYVYPEEREEFKNILREKGEIYDRPVQFYTKNKNKIYCSLSWHIVKDTSGAIIYYEGIAEDITERKQFEEKLIEQKEQIEVQNIELNAINDDLTDINLELINAKEKAEEMNRLKTNFLANMSHELRTPMIGILGFSQMLSNNVDDINEVKELGELIYSSGKRLMDTLNMILDISRIESSGEHIDFTEVDIVEEIKSVMNLFNIEAAKKNLNLIFENRFKNFIILSDSKAINCILNNLIHNAIKFTITGTVTVELFKMEINSKIWTIIEVIDTGIGIAEENLDIIFEEFRQVSEGISRNYEGIGLGLTLTKKYVDMLGGNITVKSNLNEGSVFSVYLPIESEMKIDIMDNYLNILDENMKLSEIESTIKRKKLLIVDDDETTMVYLRKILKKDFDFEIAVNGKTAIEMACNFHFDAILMDINLGKGLNGVEVLNEIKNIPIHFHTPVIAITAYAMKGDKEKYLNFGFDEYISKPFDQNQLFELLNLLLNKSILGNNNE